MKTICGILAIFIAQFGIVHSGRSTCSPECSCAQVAGTSKWVIDCSNRNFTDVPELPSPGGSITKIDLSNNKLTKVDIKQIYKFIRFLKVEVLDFSSNYISDFTGTVDSNIGVDYATLNLSNNAFTSFPRNVIPVNHDNWAKLILDFSNNRLTELTRHMFAGTNERTLFGFQFLARNNMISQIDDEAFQGVPIVGTILDLRSNRLTHLSEAFQRPREVLQFRFSDNPWNCDCHLRWIIDPIREIINDISSDPPACVAPAALQGTPIFSLKSNEFVCLPFQSGSLQTNILNQDRFTLSCPVTADPPNHEITWSVWIPNPSGGSNPIELGFTSDTITLDKIGISPRAAFRCTASNNAGSVNFDLDVRVNGAKGIPIPGTSSG